MFEAFAPRADDDLDRLQRTNHYLDNLSCCDLDHPPRTDHDLDHLRRTDHDLDQLLTADISRSMIIYSGQIMI